MGTEAKMNNEFGSIWNSASLFVRSTRTELAPSIAFVCLMKSVTVQLQNNESKYPFMSSAEPCSCTKDVVVVRLGRLFSECASLTTCSLQFRPEEKKIAFQSQTKLISDLGHMSMRSACAPLSVHILLTVCYRRYGSSPGINQQITSCSNNQSPIICPLHVYAQFFLPFKRKELFTLLNAIYFLYCFLQGWRVWV